MTDPRRPRATALAVLAAALCRPAAAQAAPGEGAVLAPCSSPAAETPMRPTANGLLQRWLLLEPLVTLNTGLAPDVIKVGGVRPDHVLVATGASTPALLPFDPRTDARRWSFHLRR